MATGRGSGDGPCIQHFTGRKVITELLLSMLRALKKVRESDRGEEREKEKASR